MSASVIKQPAWLKLWLSSKVVDVRRQGLLCLSVPTSRPKRPIATRTSRTPLVKYHSDQWLQWCQWQAQHAGEFSGYAAMDGIVVVKQWLAALGTSASVDSEAEDQARILMDAFEQGLEVTMQWHSHGSMSAFFSTTDEDAQYDYTERSKSGKMLFVCIGEQMSAVARLLEWSPQEITQTDSTVLLGDIEMPTSIKASHVVSYGPWWEDDGSDVMWSSNIYEQSTHVISPPSRSWTQDGKGVWHYRDTVAMTPQLQAAAPPPPPEYEFLKIPHGGEWELNPETGLWKEKHKIYTAPAYAGNRDWTQTRPGVWAVSEKPHSIGEWAYHADDKLWYKEYTATELLDGDIDGDIWIVNALTGRYFCPDKGEVDPPLSKRQQKKRRKNHARPQPTVRHLSGSTYDPHTVRTFKP